jgi:hemerythrin HHE cation binding domain-containing protein
MKATTLLRDQHRSLERLLARLGGERHLRMPLVLQLVEELMTHLSLEDHFFLSPIADRVGIRVDGFREDQAAVRNAVLQVVFAEGDDALFGERLRDLGAAMEGHARTVERDLLPLVESQVRADELERLGDRMQAFWDAAIVAETTTRASHVHAAE